MKIVIINTSERIGGAAIAANRLMQALNRNGARAKMLVRDKQTTDENIITINTSWIKKKINSIRFIRERMAIFFHNKFNRETLFQISIANAGTDISTHPLIKEADIIHLHWINQSFLSLKDIKKLTKLGKPIVWTLHDMWPFTGICHYAGECDHFNDKCGKCFYLQSQKPADLSNEIFNKKKQITDDSSITFITCSRWLMSEAKRSTILKNQSVEAIPNTLNTDIYCPKDKSDIRAKYNLPADKYLILFGALNVADKRKGVYYLIEALKYLKDKNPGLSGKIELVVFGKVKQEIADLFPVTVRSLGYVDNEDKIADLYNAVDLFAISSLEDNLPNTIMEAMACGTPCLGFKTGGIPEMIDHKTNGYLAAYKSIEDFANGIEWIILNSESLNLRESCLKKVQTEYSQQIVSKKYISLYEKLLNR